MTSWLDYRPFRALRASAGYAFICLLLTLPLHASERRAITHEDLWLMPRVSSPAISDDGRWAVVGVAEPAYEADAQRSALWLIDTDGKQPARQLTEHQAPANQPTFSPDGHLLAFVAKRDGDEAAQIYVIDLRLGGDARRVTQQSTGVRQPRFSPDGRQLLFVSDVYPESRNDEDNRRIDAERKARPEQVRSYDGFPIRNWSRWLDERQARVFVQDLSGGQARDLLADSELVKSPGYAGRNVLASAELEAIWAPDGESILFVASTNRHRAAHDFTHTDLYQVSLEDASVRRLTGDGSENGQDSYAQPRFAANGRTLYALVSPHGERLYMATRLQRFDWPSLQPQAQLQLPEQRAVDAYAPLADGRSVYLLSERAGHLDLLRADAGDTEARPVGKTERGIYTDLLAAGPARAPVLLALYQSASEPAELVRLDPRTGSHRALTQFASARAAALDLAPLEHFWFTAENGKSIHNMLLRPPGFDPERRYPLLVLMHGGPHTMWRDYFFLRWNYHLLAQPGYVLLLTNYSGSTGFGEAFAQSIQGDPLRGPAQEINEAADAAIARYTFIDENRQCAGGASYGGHLANWLQGTTTRYRCLISHAGLVNLESQWGTSDVVYGREVGNGGPVWEQGPIWREQNPIRLAAQFQTPTLVTIGELDYRVPLNNALEYWTVLQRQQVPSRLLVYPTENHWIANGANSRHFYAEIHAWLARWLDTETAPGAEPSE